MGQRGVKFSQRRQQPQLLLLMKTQQKCLQTDNAKVFTRQNMSACDLKIKQWGIMTLFFCLV